MPSFQSFARVLLLTTSVFMRIRCALFRTSQRRARVLRNIVAQRAFRHGVQCAFCVLSYACRGSRKVCKCDRWPQHSHQSSRDLSATAIAVLSGPEMGCGRSRDGRWVCCWQGRCFLTNFTNRRVLKELRLRCMDRSQAFALLSHLIASGGYQAPETRKAPFHPVRRS